VQRITRLHAHLRSQLVIGKLCLRRSSVSSVAYNSPPPGSMMPRPAVFSVGFITGKAASRAPRCQAFQEDTTVSL